MSLEKLDQVKDNASEGGYDEFQDTNEEAASKEQTSPELPTLKKAESRGEFVQISDVNEQVTEYDYETALKFSWKGNNSCGPYSFADWRDARDPECPPPLYFSEDQLLKQLPTDKAQILKGLVEHKKYGGLLCTDQEVLDKQSGILANVAKQLAINLLKGLSISHISLPIKIFENRSSVQRVVDFWSAASSQLVAASKESDPVERMKRIVTFQLASLYICTGQCKPFNPLLGETNQGSFSDGTRYYCEHTSHHPPISHYLLEGANGSFRMSGYYEFIGKMTGNAFISGLRGPCTLEFPDGGVVRFNAPDFKIGGAMMGERIIEGVGSVCFQDLKNNIKAFVALSTYKESGFWSKTSTGSKSHFEGLIYKCKPSDNKIIKFGKNQDLPQEIKNLKDVQQKLCEIQGSFLDKIVIDNKVFWNIDVDIPFRQIPQTPGQPIYEGKDVLPSDWRYREDLIWFQYGFMAIAANWKVKLEVQQRKDRKNRQDGEKRRQN